MIGKIKDLVIRKQELVKYIISGGTAAVVDIGFLYLFTDIFNIWYIASAVFAFLIAFGASFSLQKFWTFKNLSRDKIHKQISFFLLTSVINLFINTFLMYMFVDIVHIWYILSQILASGLIAFGSFFIYKYLIFK